MSAGWPAALGVPFAGAGVSSVAVLADGPLLASAAPSLALEFTTDILQSTRDARRPGCVVVGFALETEKLEAAAKAKLEAKDLDLVVANRVEAGSGFGTDTNRVTLLGRDGSREELPLLGKGEVADAILDRVAGLFDGR